MENEIRSVSLRLDELAAMIQEFARTAEDPGSHPQVQQATGEPGRQRLQNTVHGTFRPATARSGATSAVTQDLEMVEAMISIRGLRDRFFESDLFFDPAWSMLIDLYRAELKGQRLSVTSVCIASGVAGTTALRYVSALEDRGYLTRLPDAKDKRRAFVALTPKAREKLDAYFTKVNSQCRAA